MSINKRIKTIRNKLNFTQVQFAEKIAISNGYLAAIELENKQANERIIRLIINEFHINEHWFRTGLGEMFIDNENPSSIQILQIFKSLNPQLQDCALKQIKALDEFNNLHNHETAK